MTEPVDLDALASAYIDDELDEAARVAAQADPAVMARVAEFGRVAELLRSPVVIDPSVRESSIAAAMAHLDVLAAVNVSDTGSDSSPTVAALRPRRPRRPWSANPALVWGPIGLVAAGIVAVAVMSLASNDDSGQTSAATTFAADVSSAKVGDAADSSAIESSSDGAETATRAAASATTAGSATTAAGAATTGGAVGASEASSQLTTARAPTGVIDLGTVTDAAELGARLIGPSLAGSSPTATSQIPTASTLAPRTASPPTLCGTRGTAIAVAVLNGTPVAVYPDPTGGFVVVDPSCEQVSRLDAAGAVTP